MSSEQLPDSWPFHHETDPVGLARSHPKRQFQNYALAKCMKVFNMCAESDKNCVCVHVCNISSILLVNPNMVSLKANFCLL